MNININININTSMNININIIIIPGKIADSTFDFSHSTWSTMNHRFGADGYRLRDNHTEDIIMGSLYAGRHGREDNCVQGFRGET